MLWKAWRACPEKMLSMRPSGFSWSETDRKRIAPHDPFQAEKGRAMSSRHCLRTDQIRLWSVTKQLITMNFTNC